MDKPLLNDAKEFPDEKVLAKYLGKTRSAWEEFLNLVSSADPSLDLVWNYYRDGNAWLCKLTKKKKTICWISIWDKFFKVTFYFTEKNDRDINDLRIDCELKNSYATSKSIGRLKPLTIEVKSKKRLRDVAELIGYKSHLK
jgi:Protein of unknown function (DUF3788)